MEDRTMKLLRETVEKDLGGQFMTFVRDLAPSAPSPEHEEQPDLSAFM